MKHLRYFRYLARHKWFVLVAGLGTHAPWWRLLIHDWSKFTPAEWFPYVDNFYGPKVHEFAVVERENAFDRAWLHHQHANPHHWQHWVLREDNGATKALRMPYPLICEMVADWMGAGRTITGQWEASVWYEKNVHKMQLHSYTRYVVETLLIEQQARGRA